MKKIVLIFSFFLTLISCNNYDGETRFIFEATIIDTKGNPIEAENIDISYSSNSHPISGYNSISKGVTDNQGKINLIFPAADNDDEIKINISSYNSIFQGKLYNLRNADFTNYKFILNPIVLYKLDEITNLSIILNNINLNMVISDIKIEAIQPNESVNYYYYLNNYNQEIQTNFSLIKDQNFVLKYTIKEYNGSTFVNSVEHSENLYVGNQELLHTITY